MTAPTPGTGRAAGRLAAWASSWLAGGGGFDETLEHVTAGEHHAVAGLPGVDGEAPLGWALAELRRRGAVAVRLVLPVAGDLAGLPAAPPDLRCAALDAGAAVVTVLPEAGRDGEGLALVPALVAHGHAAEGTTWSVRWQAFATPPVVPPYRPLAEAEQQLRATLAESTTALARLDVARWRPELAAALADLRADARHGRLEGSDLPPDWPPRARRLLGSADQLGRVVALADGDHGAAVSAADQRGRAGALTALGRAVREARLAAYNCFGVEPPG